MAKRSTGSDTGILHLINSLGACTPPDLLRLLESSETPPDIRIACALAMLCSREPQGQIPAPDSWRIPLDAIAASTYPLAEAALRHVAGQARNSRIRLEAVRRLGRLANTKDSVELLRETAREGPVAPANFQSESVTPDAMREAALLAMGDLKRPVKTDCDAVLEVLVRETPAGDTTVFRAGAQALSSVAKASDLGRILELGEKVQQSQMLLRLLCACSTFEKKSLLANKAQLSAMFIRALDRYEEQRDLHDRAIELARRMSCAELVKGLADRYSGDSLEHGRGRVCAAALEAYGAPDDTLTRAYLAFARAEGNAHSKSPCIVGLTRCTQKGSTTEVLRDLLHHLHPGYRRILMTEAGLHLAGDMRTLVYGMCDALDALPDQSRRTQAAWTCAVGILRASVCQSEDAPVFDDLNQFRQREQRRSRDEETPPGLLIRLLNEVEPEANGVHWLANRLASPDVGIGATTLSECMVALDDELSRLIIGTVLKEAAKCRTPSDLGDDSSLRKFEQLAFTRCDRWMREHLPAFLVTEGALNRYVLDVLRRRHPEFVARVQAALAEVGSSDDAAALLRALAEKGGRDSVKLLSQAVAFVAGTASDTTKVRTEALRLVRDAMTSADPSVSPEARKELLSQIHGRFEDTREVRLMAYNVAASAADPMSILPLRERQRTDQDRAGQEAISAALATIRHKLIEARPEMKDVHGLVAWLKNVGDLGDPGLTSKVVDLLAIPHSSREVLVAAMACIEKLGNPKAVQAVERFIAETSPSGDVLRAARHARAVLEGRQDVQLLDILPRLFPDAPAVLETDYQCVLGARVPRLAKALGDAASQYEAGHWDDLVTKLDGVCDLLVRHIFERYPQLLGLDETKASKLARQDYANRIAMTEFRNAFPVVQPLLLAIHDARQEASTAHIEDSDGAEKPGVNKETADFVLDQFRTAFVKVMCHLATTQGVDKAG